MLKLQRGGLGQMSIWQTSITISNQTGDSFNLNAGASSGIDAGVWPPVLTPNKAFAPFQQGWDFQIKFNAVYENAQGTSTLNMSMYADSVQVFHGYLSQVPDDPPIYPASSGIAPTPFIGVFTIAI
jgi:hypothetical protein